MTTTKELIEMLQRLVDCIDPFIKLPFRSTTLTGVNPDSTEWVLKEAIAYLERRYNHE